MGVVFMAEQLHPVRRRVALKIVKPGMDTRKVIARFEAERQALAMMDHANIAKVLEAGATAAGRPYFMPPPSMPPGKAGWLGPAFVEGIPLRMPDDAVSLRFHTPIDDFMEEKKMNPKTRIVNLAPRLALAAAALLCAFIVSPARAALSFVQNFGSVGSGGGQFIRPEGVTVDSTGNVYVADDINGRIDRFNPANFAGTFTSFGSFGSGSGQFRNPAGVAVDSAGNVYVADYFNNRIDRFNPANFAGTFTSFGSTGSGSGQFITPYGVAVDPAGNVYVADGSNGRIDRFNPTNFAGTFTSFGISGLGSGQFSNPEGVALGSAGNVYVADTSNGRIDRFNPANFAGTFASFGSAGSGSGQFSTPHSVTLDSAGDVYVADESNNRIDSFNPGNFAGTFSSFGSTGSGNGQFNTPTGVTLDSAGNVYVADFNNDRIVELTGAASAPEPSTLSLLGLGAMGLLGRRRPICSAGSKARVGCRDHWVPEALRFNADPSRQGLLSRRRRSTTLAARGPSLTDPDSAFTCGGPA